MDPLDTFIKNKTGVGIDTDGYFGFQCMDLMHEYCRTVLGLNDLRVLAASNAKSVYLNFNTVFGHELFERIPNTPTNVPQKGDIMFYDWGTDGHVDVFIQGDVNNYRAFSQNFPTGSKPVVVNHPTYNGVLGWLRFKGTSPALSTNGGLPANYSDIVAGSSNWDEVKKLGFTSLDALKQKLNQPCPPQKTYTDQKKRITDALNEIG
jgi:hypothetical protein